MPASAPVLSHVLARDAMRAPIEGRPVGVISALDIASVVAEA